MRFVLALLFISVSVLGSDDCYDSLHAFTGAKLSDHQVELAVKFLADRGHYLKAKNNDPSLKEELMSEFNLDISMITLYRRAKSLNVLIKNPSPTTNRNKIKITKQRVDTLLKELESRGIVFGKNSFEKDNKTMIEELYKELFGESVNSKSLYNWINKNLKIQSNSREVNTSILKEFTSELIESRTIYENRMMLIKAFIQYKGINPKQSQLDHFVRSHLESHKRYFTYYRVVKNFQDKKFEIQEVLDKNNYLLLGSDKAKKLLRSELFKIYGDFVSEVRMLQWIEDMGLEAIDFNISEKSLKIYEWFQTIQKGHVLEDDSVKRIRKEDGYEIDFEDKESNPEDFILSLDSITSNYVINEMNISDPLVEIYLKATIDDQIYDPHEIAHEYGITFQDVVYAMNWLVKNQDVRDALIEILGG